MTDLKRGIASVMGDNGMLVLKCDKNGPGSLYIDVVSKEYLGGVSSRMRDMKYRFDGGQPGTILATYDERSALLFNLKPGSKGGDFISSLRSSSKLVVEVTDFRYSGNYITFDTTGAAATIAKAAQTCGDTNWTS